VIARAPLSCKHEQRIDISSRFQARPFWWEAYEPKAETLTDVPSQARVAIIGAGYAGLAAALQLAKEGIDAVVLEAAQPGFGAVHPQWRDGVGRGSPSASAIPARDEPERLAELYAAAADSFGLVERLIEDEGIDCEWTRSGRFGGACVPGTLPALEGQGRAPQPPCPGRRLHAGARAPARGGSASDYYHGGLVVRRAAHLHPAKYFAGLYRVARERGAVICAEAPVTRLDRQGAGWLVETGRGTVRAGDVIVATNGYTGTVTPALRRRVIPSTPTSSRPRSCRATSPQASCRGTSRSTIRAGFSPTTACRVTGGG
jgi:glycine/D-amino acid oxidase-like deaminating enzyme